ncbi:MAG: hypothetical protein GX434_13655 [Peptococcaceae bacterium]|nr:hypothetical protein [Peptococcaceae bacterium]
MQKVSHPDKYQEVAFFGDFFKKDQFSGKAGKYIGIGLIAVGCIMIFDKIVIPQSFYGFHADSNRDPAFNE